MYDMYVDISHINIEFKVGMRKFTKTSFTSRMLYYLQYSYKVDKPVLIIRESHRWHELLFRIKKHVGENYSL